MVTLKKVNGIKLRVNSSHSHIRINRELPCWLIMRGKNQHFKTCLPPNMGKLPCFTPPLFTYRYDTVCLHPSGSVMYLHSWGKADEEELALGPLNHNVHVQCRQSQLVWDTACPSGVLL